MRLAVASLALFLGSSQLLAQRPVWAVSGAPFRAVFRAEKEQPAMPESGWLLEVPELGQMLPALDDVVLTDSAGKPVLVARLHRNEGASSLLLAQKAAPGDELHVYFGGRVQRRADAWQAKPGLLLETRRLPAGTSLDTLDSLKSAWSVTRESDGAGFVGGSSIGGNPFGESAGYMSKLTGWLKLPSPKTTLYTVSSDASFLLADGRLIAAWPGVHSAQTNADAVPRGEVASSGAPVKIEYWHAKSGDAPATMVLGWMDGGKAKEISANWWMRPGRTSLVRLEHSAGWPVAQPVVELQSYIGWSNSWFYETRFRGGDALPSGWSARWEFSDGAVIDGSECRRVVMGNAPLRATLVFSRGKDEVRMGAVVRFHGVPRAASINDPGDVRRYIELLAAEKPEKLVPAVLSAHLLLLREFGDDDVLGRYGSAWLARNNKQDEPLWITAQLARIRSISQRSPERALQEMRQFDMATNKRFAKELGMLRMDVVVFGMKDAAEAAALASRLGFENPNSDIGRLAKIRVGDAYRLLGKPDAAVEVYRSVQKSVADDTAGRKYAAGDRANSVTVESLITQGERNAAMARLVEWEADHPMAKYESDFLLLRGRVLMEFARWNEAMQEIESFRAMHPDSPYQIIADFHRARAMSRINRADEARKIWQDIATKYPKHELAAESARLAAAK